MSFLCSVPMMAGFVLQASQPSTAGRALSLLPIVLIFVIFYFLLIRPQQKRQKEHRKLIESLGKGDRVLTSGGIYGTVVGSKDDVVVLKIAEDVKVEFAKSAISFRISREE